MSTNATGLPQKSIDWLQQLIQVNIDSRDGFREAAKNLDNKNSSLGSTFQRMSDERASQANELQALVAQNAEKPQQSGSVSAAAHRTWMDIKTALGGGEQAVLDEAERGEDYIKDKYQSAIKDLASCRCVQTLEKHISAVKTAHDKVRDLRDAHRNAKS